MLCSELELGLSSDHHGIIELDAKARTRRLTASYLQVPDVVLDIAITPNRGDCLSILGLAREVAALFDSRLQPAEVKPVKAPHGCQRRGTSRSTLKSTHLSCVHVMYALP